MSKSSLVLARRAWISGQEVAVYYADYPHPDYAAIWRMGASRRQRRRQFARLCAIWRSCGAIKIAPAATL